MRLLATFSKTIFLGVLLTFSACGPDLPPEVAEATATLPKTVDYNYHIKPLLSDRCFACHGPDAEKQQADLRLDIAENAYAALSSGAGYAIVAGKPHKSEMVHRILVEDPEVRMPPPESNLSLTTAEKALLIKWIEQGAEYKPHWAFTKPVRPEIPTAGADWAINEIDHFIAEGREQQGVGPAPEAERSHLIRRLFFDLTGLPPQLDELDRWLTDPRPDYYENLVDELLARPAYGERMTAHWLDVSRFADSEGYLDDFHHTFWPYRDWVINAFNQNLPYDHFITWQLGGDQTPEATSEQVLATAFNRNHKQNSEGGIIPEEFRVEYVADRTNTVGSAFMALTVGCARCHDHKYDPFSQKDYYQLFSFFNSTAERGDGIFGYNALENGQQIPNVLSMNAGPVLPLPNKEVANIREFLLQEIDDKQAELQQLAQTNTAAVAQWRKRQDNAQVLKQAVDAATVSHLTFDRMSDGKGVDLVRSNKAPYYHGNIKSVPGVQGQAVRSDASGQFVADGLSSSFERMEPFTVSFWIQVPEFFEEAHVLYNGNNRIQGYRGWDIMLDSNRVHFRLNHAHPYQSLDIRAPEALPLNEWVNFVWTYDGSSRAEGMKLYRNGEPIPVDIRRNHLYRSTKPYTDHRATIYMPYRGMIIGNRHYDQDFTGGLLDEVRILNRESDPLTARYLYDTAAGTAAFTTALAEGGPALDQFYDHFIDPQLEQERAALQEIQLREITTIDTVQEIMVMGDFTRARPTFVLDRGVYDAHGEPVSRAVPNAILPWPEDLPRNRYGLAQWLTHPDHPLTARVAVNQIWYLMFGRGIVETVEDFGNQGALPTHPDLLDWLAVDFIEHGWDVKRLIRQMVLSATYRQSSKIRPELQESDPDNNLLARGPRYRRSAEMVRDNILASSGLLNATIGGPSAFPYQPPGLWKEVMTHPFFPEYAVDYENGLYRRSIYTFWKRNMPPPGMLIFDAASRAECQVRRQRSSSPLQALLLLSDTQMIEGCRALAAQRWRENEGDVPQAIDEVFRQLTSRIPTEREREILAQQYTDELAYFRADPQRAAAFTDIGKYDLSGDLPELEVAALARVANTVLNTTEAYYKN